MVVLLTPCCIEVKLETSHDSGRLADRQINVIEVELKSAQLYRLVKPGRDHIDDLVVEVVVLEVALHLLDVAICGHFTKLHLEGGRHDS